MKKLAPFVILFAASAPVFAGLVATSVPEIDAASGTGVLALLVGVIALVSERRRRR